MPPVPRPKRAKTKGESAPSQSRRNLIIAIVGAVVVAGVLIVGSLVLTGGSDSSSPDTAGSGPAFLEGIPQDGSVLGNPDATVTLIQYEDIQCPICKNYTDDAFGTIVAEYVKPGKVKVDFRGLAFLGEDSDRALRIALAAGKQNHLWDVVELFYKEQGQENSGWVTDAKIDSILEQVPGLDAAKVKADAESAEITKEIASVQDEAAARQVPGTPTFFIGIGADTPYEISPPSLTPDGFRPALDDALNG